MDYSTILFKFRSCMEEIGDALREVLGTSDKYKFTEIASAISNLCEFSEMKQVTSGYKATKNSIAIVIAYEKFTQNGSTSTCYSTCKKNGESINPVINKTLFSVHHSDGALNGACYLQIYTMVLKKDDVLTGSVVCNPSYSSNTAGIFCFVS